MNKLFVYHDKDNDGIMCRALMEVKIAQGVNFLSYGYDYNRPIQPILDLINSGQFIELHIADVSFDIHSLHKILTLCKDFDVVVYMYDHHASVIEDYGEELLLSDEKEGYYQTYQFKAELGYKFRFYYTNQMSASELVWGIATDWKNRPAVLALVGEYDFRVNGRFDRNKRELEAFNFGCQLYNREDLLNLFKNYVYNNSTPSSEIAAGKIIMAYTELQAKRLSTRTMSATVFGNDISPEFNDKTVLIANCGSINPTTYYPDGEYDFVCVYFHTGYSWKYSLRPGNAKNDLSLLKIAKYHGGGGHEQACGWVSDENLFFD